MELIKKYWLVVLEFLGLHHPEKKVPTFTQVSTPVVQVETPSVKQVVTPTKKVAKKATTARKKTTKKKAE